MADSVLAGIQNTSSNNSEDQIGTLTQSICDTLISASSSNENINEDYRAQNSFLTAKQALIRNMNQKGTGNGMGQSSSGYNPANQARKLLGAKRRFNDPKGSNESNYRDEGRDINTEFR